MLKYALKISRNWFLFIIAVVNGTVIYVVPMLNKIDPNFALFTSVVLNAFIVLLTGEMPSTAKVKKSA